MSAQRHSTGAGIPFPQTQEHGSSPPASGHGLSAQHMPHSASPHQQNGGFAMPATPSSPRHRPISDDQSYSRHVARSNASSSSSSSMRGGESLPSIRNLLSSISQEEHASPSSSMNRPPSAPALYTSEQSAQHAMVRPGPPSSPRQHRQTYEAGTSAIREHHHAGTSSHSWDAKMYMRSMSPPKRPPLAPSAYAHSHYTVPSQARTPNNPPEEMTAPYAGPSSQRPTSTIRHSPTSSLSGGRMAQQAAESTSLRMSGMRTGVPPPPLIITGGHGQPTDDIGPHSMLAKRTIQAQRDVDEPPLSPAAVRRRHTVGSLEEPVGLLPGPSVSFDSRDAESTPRTFQPGRLASPITRPGLESPTTPTAGSMMSRRSLEGPPVAEARREHYSSNTGRESASAVPHHVYMQHSAQSTGSMPSLSSSISTASVSSERVRVHSLEGRFDGKPPPSAWHGNVPGVPHMSGSETFTSPQSSVWHSRSSTLDSIETSSSMGSTPSGGSYPRHGPRSAGAEYTIREAPTTPKHSRSDYNRDWRFPHPYRSAEEAQQHQQMLRSRHESLSTLSCSSPSGPHADSGAAGHMPPSPFANLSLASPPPHNNQHGRPRAQTMTFADRRIAPLPSHSIHAQAMLMGGPDNGDSPLQAVSPQRSYSSHSVSSLPQRVSSMDIDASRANMGSMGPVFDFHQQGRQIPPSGSRSAGGTVIVSGNSASSGGGAGAAKYECGWCGKRFSRPSSLKIHHHSHTGEKPFVCSEHGCGRTFSVQSNLRRHQKSHIVNARKLASGEMAMHGPFGGSRVAPASGMHLTQSASLPSHSGGFSEMVQGSIDQGTVLRAPFKGVPERFSSLRERKTSVSSSTAADGDDEEEEFEEEEEEEASSGHGHSFVRSKRPFSLEGSDVMQDIREEAPPSSPDERPATAGSVQTRFQGLLNPPSGDDLR